MLVTRYYIGELYHSFLSGSKFLNFMKYDSCEIFFSRPTEVATFKSALNYSFFCACEKVLPNSLQGLRQEIQY